MSCVIVDGKVGKTLRESLLQTNDSKPAGNVGMAMCGLSEQIKNCSPAGKAGNVNRLLLLTANVVKPAGKAG